MKKLVVQKVLKLQGALAAPGDKSISHRAIMMGSLAHGKTYVKNFLTSGDCQSTIDIFRAMGVQIKQDGNSVQILGKGLNSLKPPKKILNAGNSGTTARILLGLLSGQPFNSRLTGDKYLCRRPMKRVVEPLTQMGARISGPDNANHLPLRIEAKKLRSIHYRLPVASAQVKSALLLAGLFTEGNTVLIEPTPTRDHTERMFRSFEIPISKKGNTITLHGPVAPFKGRTLSVPGDFSSAAFFIVAGLIVPNSKIVLKRVGINSTRTGLLEVLKKMGASIEISPMDTAEGEEPVADLTIESSNLKSIEVGNRLVPRMIDEFPIFAVAATQAKGTTVVENRRRFES